MYVRMCVRQQYGKNANVICLNDECESLSLESIKGLHEMLSRFLWKRIQDETYRNGNSSNLFACQIKWYTFTYNNESKTGLYVCMIRRMDKDLITKKKKKTNK